MTFTDTVIDRKVTGNTCLRAICRTFEDGSVTFGKSVAQKGDKNWSTGFGFSEKQACSFMRKTWAEFGGKPE